jgi:DNA (cytosine-5)-methyltransferase 1
LDKAQFIANLKPWKTVQQAISHYPELLAGEVHTDVPNHQTASIGEVNLKRLRATAHDGGSRKSLPEEMKLECHKKHNGHSDVYGRMSWKRPAPTITGGCSNITKGRFAHPEQDRGISLRESAALQTFPDNFIFEGALTHVALQIGNAVPVELAGLLASHIYNSKYGTQKEVINIDKQQVLDFALAS